MVIVGNEDLLWQQVLEQHVDVVGEEDLLEQQVVGEVDLLPGLVLLYSMKAALLR